MDQVGTVGHVEHVLVRPTLVKHAIEVGTNDPLVALVEAGIEIEDRLSRAIDEAARFAMRHRAIAADQIVRELDDHPNPAKPAALEKCGAKLRDGFDLIFRHRELPRQTWVFRIQFRADGVPKCWLPKAPLAVAIRTTLIVVRRRACRRDRRDQSSSTYS